MGAESGTCPGSLGHSSPLSRTFTDWVRKVLVNVEMSNKKGCSLKRWLLVEYTVSIHFMPHALILL